MEYAMELGREAGGSNEANQGRDPVPFESLNWERFYQNYRKPGYIPGYEIGHKLGGGVFGIVYKARKESIGKAYAIKFLKIDDPSVKGQVVRELEQVSLFAQVDHPNLVSIEDKGVVDGIPFIVMGYAGEDTLKDRLEDGALCEEDALSIFVQVCRGVQALHDRSLIHFDLKPANVFLKGDIARVGDYGLSKLVSTSRMSLSFGRGTPYYMAPEMLERRGDHRSDIYSLGVIFYECLSGEVPFQGDSEWEVLRGHEKGAVRYPGSIPLPYRRILDRMLEKDPEKRVQSLGEVLQALRAPGRLGESIILDLASRSSQVSPQGSASRRNNETTPPPPPMTRTASSAPTAPSDPAPANAAALPSPGSRQSSTDSPQELNQKVGVVSGLLRALVIALLLPIKVLGVGLLRGLQITLRLPMMILSFLGQVTLFALAGFFIFLIIMLILGA